MTRNGLSTQYFDWMYQLVCNERRFRKVSYRKLLNYLNETEFSYLLEMDSNRAADGIDLRYRFGYEHEYDSNEIEKALDNRPCSVLEMMIALALRCEEHIMGDPDIGNRTGQWFWNMVACLGLYSMTDEEFDHEHVEFVIARFLNRDYGRDGEGGLFVVAGRHTDLRKVEIWYQMCWYLDRII